MILRPLRSSTRGAALLTAVMFAVLLGVIARGIMVLTLGAQSQRTTYQMRAEQAAQAGLEYAKTRLAEDPGWKGDDTSGSPLPSDPGARVTISTDSLLVVEANGNVYGKLNYQDGSQSRFHIRFNYQDGTGGEDGLDDPGSVAWSSSRLVSVNNLESAIKKNLPQPNLTGHLDPDQPPAGEVPSRAALIQVEGIAGPAVDNSSFANPFELSTGFRKTYALSSVLKVVLDDPAGPAMVQAGSDITIASREDVTVSTSDDTTPNIRGKGDVSVQGHGPDLNFNMEDGDIREQDGSLSVSGDVNFSDSLNVQVEPAADGYTELKWDDVSKPQSHGHRLQAGVYILLPVGAASNTPPDPASDKASDQELVYFDMNLEEFEHTVLPYIGTDNPPQGTVMTETFDGNYSAPTIGDLVGGSQPIVYHPERDKIVVTGDIKVEATGSGTIDFAVLSSVGTSMKSNDAGVTPGSTPLKDRVRVGVEIHNASIYTEGRMAILGAETNVTGATLIGEGDLRLNTSSLSVTQPGEENLSLYFKGDINVSSYTQSEYGDFDLVGTVYSWSNITFNLGDSDQSRWGSLSLTGNLVAFGGEPGTDDPGKGYGTSLGDVSIRAQSVDIEYDPTAVTQLLETNSLGDRVRIATVSTWGGK